MKFLYKILYLLAITSIAFMLNNPSVKANELKLDAELRSNSNLLGRVEKVIITPVKKNQKISNSEQNYAKEVAYYFSRNGIQGNSVNYVVFENGNYFEFNTLFQRNLTKTLDSSKTLVLLLIYENTFDISSPTKGLETIKNILREKVIPISDISSKDQIFSKKIEIANSDNSVIMNTTNSFNLEAQIREIFADIDYSKKEDIDFKIANVVKKENLSPNVIFDYEITVSNNSEKSLFLGKTQSLAFKTPADSKFFVNEAWFTTSTPLIDDKSLIDSKSNRTYIVKFKAPLMPGNYSEDINLVIGNKEIEKFKIEFSVADVGQKVLKIRRTGFDYQPVRAEPNNRTAEVGRASIGAEYLYTEFKNNHYKINFNNKDAWVIAGAVEVLKK